MFVKRLCKYIFLGLLLGALSGSGCNKNDMSPGSLTFHSNDTFLLNYSADLKPSSPTSFTANFGDRDIYTEDHSIKLATINNATVTLIQSHDSFGVPVWHETFELFVTPNGYRTIRLSASPSLITFASAVRNEAGGPIDKDTKTQSSEINCSQNFRFYGERDLLWNPIGPGYKATIDMTSVKWSKC